MIDIRIATPEDNAALQAIQARCPMGTDLVVCPVNTPDFFARAKAYQQYRIFVACDRDNIAGSAACALRTTMVAGSKLTAGYEFQYITSPDYQKRGIASRLHKRIEDYLLGSGASLSYCLIIEGNLTSMRAFERHGFALHRTLTMPVLLVHRPLALNSPGTVRPIIRADLAAVADLLNDTWRGYDFYEPMSEESLESLISRLPGYSFENLLVLEDGNEIVACLGFWDWSRVTQITVKSLSLKLHAARLLLDVAGNFRAIPRVPGPGETLRQYCLTPIGFKDPKHLSALLQHVSNIALSNGTKQMLCTCERGHPLLSGMKGFWRSDVAVHLYIKRLKPDVTLTGRPVFVDGIDL